MIKIKKISIVDIKCDAIVNAANEQLTPGGGVCGAIFRAAGYDNLNKECIAIGHCDTGKAVITNAYNLNAKYIIHTVGPIWGGGNNNEEKLLKSSYISSLHLATKNNCKSIAFPLISAGIFGYPLVEAWKIALDSCKEFLNNNKIDICFAVIDDNIIDLGINLLNKI